MKMASAFALLWLCFTSVSAFADDSDKDYREANKRYWEHQREMNKAEMEDDKERR